MGKRMSPTSYVSKSENIKNPLCDAMNGKSDATYAFSLGRLTGEPTSTFTRVDLDRSGVPPLYRDQSVGLNDEDARRFDELGKLVQRALPRNFLVQMAKECRARGFLPQLVAKFVIQHVAEVVYPHRLKVEAAHGWESIDLTGRHLRRDGSKLRIDISARHLERQSKILARELAADWDQPRRKGDAPWYWFVEPLWLNLFVLALCDTSGVEQQEYLGLILQNPHQLVAANPEVFDQREAELTWLLAQQLASFQIDGRNLPAKPVRDLEDVLGLHPTHEQLSPENIRRQKDNFHPIEETPFPTADLSPWGFKSSFIQLRPHARPVQYELSVTQEDPVETMWQLRNQLSDLDADVLDILSWRWLEQANESGNAAIEIDEILRIRGIKPKKGGKARRGGYESEQLAKILGHYCPAKSRIESAGWGHRVSFRGGRTAARPVKWAFSRKG